MIMMFARHAFNFGRYFNGDVKSMIVPEYRRSTPVCNQCHIFNSDYPINIIASHFSQSNPCDNCSIQRSYCMASEHLSSFANTQKHFLPPSNPSFVDYHILYCSNSSLSRRLVFIVGLLLPFSHLLTDSNETPKKAANSA